MKIFITGGSGLLGQYLNIELSKSHEILTQYNSHVGNCSQFNSVKLDLLDYKKLEETFQTFQPEIVIHAAAISNAEMADSLSADFVYDVNVNLVKRIAQLCNQYNSKLLYLSTDQVYAGYRGLMLKEDAKLIPISLYAETKLMGEVKVREVANDFLILRHALMYGFGLNHSRNFFHHMYDELKANKPVKLFIDQFRTPLAIHDSARMIGEIIQKDISCETINFGGTERVSRFELAEIFCEMTGLNKNLLVGVTMEDAGQFYKVADVSLNIDKLLSYGITPNSLEQSMREVVISLQ